MTENRLAEIAQRMRAQLVADPQRPYVQHHLFGGLAMLLQRKPGDVWRLAIARTDTAPSATEAGTVAKAFGLVDVSWAWTTKPRVIKAYVGRGANAGWREVEVTYKVAECQWIER